MNFPGSSSKGLCCCYIVLWSFGLCKLNFSLAEEDSIFSSNSPPGYGSALLKAKQQTTCLNWDDEILPIFDEISLSTKPAACRSDECRKCFECISNSSRDPELAENMECMNYYFADLNLETSRQWYFDESHPQPPAPTFHCTSNRGKEYNMTHFKMEYTNINYSMDTIPKDFIPRVFVVEKETDGKWDVHNIISQKFWFLVLHTKLFSTYRIRVTAISPMAIYRPLTSVSIQIHAVQNIGKPRNLRLIRSDLQDATRPKANALIRWESSSGTNASCDYDIYYMDDDMRNRELNKAEDAFWVSLSGLTLGRNYTVNVIEKFGSQQSLPATMHLEVPSCLHFFSNSYQRCPPPMPTEVHIENETMKSLWVVWSPPMFSSDTNRIIEYHLTVDLFDGTISDTSRLFSGKIAGDTNTTKAKVNNIHGIKGRLRVSLIARSGGGESKEVVAWFVLKTKVVPSFTKTWVIFTVLIVLVVLVVSFFLFKSFRDKLQRQRKRHEYFEVNPKNLEKETMMTPIKPDRYSTKWEIDLGNLEVGDVIGEGFFGLVRKAILHKNGESIIVAVKTLRESVDTKDAEKFWEEFEILKGLGRHRHVVGLIGMVRKHVPALIVEYCDGGDLQTHLRKVYHSQVHDLIFPSSSSDLPCFDATIQNSMVTNEAYFARDDEEILGLEDLLSYARQIACGMEFLSLNKIVHRDLAARNVLVSGPKKLITVKIADFGLSRDVYEQNWYKKTSNGKMPIKWLAVECLLQEVYTTQSDVWAYGILLWEIITFGGIPYPGVENRRIFDLLKTGYRMSQPANCSDELYALMKHCWAEKPANRPDFPTIRVKLEEMIEKISGAAYFTVDSSFVS